MNERIANAIAPGGSAEHVRGYLKTTAERCWRLVNWLTHANNATRNDAELALDATSHVINNYAASVLKSRIAAPERKETCRNWLTQRILSANSLTELSNGVPHREIVIV